MKHINFLAKAPRDVVKLSSGKFELNYLWIMVISASILFIGLVYAYIQKKRIDAAQEQLTVLGDEVARTKAKAAAQKKGSDALPKKSTSLPSNPISWSSLLGELAISLPSSAHITKISGSLADKRMLFIEADADYLADVSAARKNLENFKWCETIDLVSIKESEKLSDKQSDKASDVVDEEGLSFRLECKLR